MYAALISIHSSKIPHFKFQIMVQIQKLLDSNHLQTSSFRSDFSFFVQRQSPDRRLRDRRPPNQEFPLFDLIPSVWYPGYSLRDRAGVDRARVNRAGVDRARVNRVGVIAPFYLVR